jgi:hypothetical protein
MAQLTVDVLDVVKTSVSHTHTHGLFCFSGTSAVTRADLAQFLFSPRPFPSLL